jgi:glutamine synthetase type III
VEAAARLAQFLSPYREQIQIHSIGIHGDPRHTDVPQLEVKLTDDRTWTWGSPPGMETPGEMSAPRKLQAIFAETKETTSESTAAANSQTDLRMGYSSDWHTMAVEERGLRNIPTTADALAALIDDDVTALFERTGVLSSVELESRYEVYAEQYILSIAVEAKLTAEIARTSVYPAALAYLRDLTTTVAGAAELGVELEATAVKTIAEEANGLLAAIAQLEAATGTHEFESTADHMQFCANTVRALMDGVRARADALEALIADEYWPLPKYREMLFIR